MSGIQIFKRIGFTLAEILVTLGVIGAVAAMTVPTLVQDIQDTQYKTAWKKTYTDMNQVTQRILLDNAGSIKGLFSTTTVFRDIFANYVQYTKLCSASDTVNNCWHDGSNWRYMHTSPTFASDNPGMVLNNGTLLRFIETNSNCSPKCSRLTIDINGFKSPNTIGKDIHYVDIFEGSIKPMTTTIDSCSPSGSGYGCATKYLYQ
jgi:type II secretory pathway pseudopilin PulG